MDKVTRQCPQTTPFRRERRAEAVSNRGPSAYQPNALPLGQTGSLQLQRRVLRSSRMRPLIVRLRSVFIIHRSGGSGTWLVPRETATISPQVLFTPYNRAPVYSVTLFEAA